MKKLRFLPLLVLILWVGLTLLAWFSPVQSLSEAERRPLAQRPQLTADTLLSGQFMTDFEDYALDQFPLRDSFRSLKALFSRYVLRQQDNNGIYTAQDHLAELCAPLDEASLRHALQQLQLVQALYLEDNDRVFAAVIPDKSYYLAPQSGHVHMDHAGLMDTFARQLPWAQHIDLTAALTLEDYYRTDTHWRQECLTEVVQTLGEAMDLTPLSDATVSTPLEDFYGVYYGQAALPVQPEGLSLVESPLLSGCRVYNYTTDSYGPVYDTPRLQGSDPYEVYLSGAQSLLRLENPQAATDRELILFRDSYGSALAPLLMENYAAITLIDIRYIQPQLLGRYVEFDGKDVLFLYSSLVLNKNLI